MIRYFLIFLLVLFLIPNIEGFKTNEFYRARNIPIDDRVYLPYSDKQTPDHTHLLSNYFVMNSPERDHRPGLISNIRDEMGIDSHHYLFESPHLYKPSMDKKTKKKIKKEVLDYVQNKDYTSFLDRPITYSDETEKPYFLGELQLKDDQMIHDPFKFPYRDPSSNRTLGNKIVYDFSDSVDFDMELREREQRLRGFRRPILDKENDFTSMTTCTSIDEEGTDYDCSKYGLYYNHDANLKLAKNNDYSHSICCHSP